MSKDHKKDQSEKDDTKIVKKKLMYLDLKFTDLLLMGAMSWWMLGKLSEWKEVKKNDGLD